MTKRLDIDRTWLHEQYILKNRAIYDIANEIGCASNTLGHRLKQYEIPIRPRCDAAPDTRRKMSESRRGKPSGMAGKTQSAESRNKMSISRKGKPLSPERKAKLLASNIGREYSPETRAKISAAMKGKTNCAGHSPSKATRAKLSAANRGEKSARWQGGISFEPYCPKFTLDLRRRVRAFFDNRCMFCGKPQSECKYELAVHHVSYDKMICCNGKPVKFAALCPKHHSMTNTNQDRWEAISCRIIEEIWQGRSYYTKEEWEKM